MNDLAMEQERVVYDAIVIGTGISGGWAAKELTEAGLDTLVLDRGRNIVHGKDYVTASMHPWEFEHRDKASLELQLNFGTTIKESDTFALNIHEQPYIKDKPFVWTRSHQVGGRSLIWARQTQRWSDFDFEGPLRDGYAIDWPIRYRDICEWYTYVEHFVGISGNKDNLEVLPDGVFLPPIELNCVESYFASSIKSNFSDRHLIHGRCAHLTEPGPHHLAIGREKCTHRGLCSRGCAKGGYFSSNSATMFAAEQTGHMTLRPHSVVQNILVDDNQQRATGVRIIDAITKIEKEYYAKIVFLNASALNSVLLLLNSKSSRFPDGIGNDYGILGKYICWHNYRGRVEGEFDGLLDHRPTGKKSNPGYIPRFRNVRQQETDFLRGYASCFAAGRPIRREDVAIGAQLKRNLLANELGNWRVKSWMIGEVIPQQSNMVYLDKALKDHFGIPLLRINCDWSKNDEDMIRDYIEQMTNMFGLAGFKHINAYDTKAAPGSDIHEMGGARMGNDPKTSVLNKWNQIHECKNIFVTDGSCMVSGSTQNPSLTYMALTARAADYAVKLLKAGLL